MPGIYITFALLLAGLLVGCDGSQSRPSELTVYDSTKYQRVSINYEILGKQDTVLVFIHGWNLNMRYWDEQVRYFQSRYRILNLDLAGHGNSGKDRNNWTIESFARDITHIMQKEGIDKAILIGHSLGGNVALQISTSVPERILRIIAVDCFKNVGFEITDDFRDGFQDHYAKFKRNYTEMADEVARENTRTKDREVINRIVKDYKSANPKIALAVYQNVVQNHAMEKAQLRRLPFKLYIISSDYMPVDEEALAKYAPFGYEIIPVYGAGHFPMVEQPGQLNAAIDSALTK
jgi:pimeloyl-ACP methyl ester carboxylesterase